MNDPWIMSLIMSLHCLDLPQLCIALGRNPYFSTHLRDLTAAACPHTLFLIIVSPILYMPDVLAFFLPLKYVLFVYATELRTCCFFLLENTSPFFTWLAPLRGHNFTLTSVCSTTGERLRDRFRGMTEKAVELKESDWVFHTGVGPILGVQAPFRKTWYASFADLVINTINKLNTHVFILPHLLCLMPTLCRRKL